MKSQYIPFELDQNSIFLRKKELKLHHQKLNMIRTRRNPFFNEQPDYNKLHRTKSDHLYYIQRDNEIMSEKLKKIHNRKNQLIDTNKLIKHFLNEKKKTINSVNKINKKLLIQSNNDFYKRLNSTKSVISPEKISNDYILSRKIFTNLRRIKPNNLKNNNLYSKYNQIYKSHSVGKLPSINNSNSNRTIKNVYE